ncbi:MAG: GMC family oxidoreductase N-terminal domain-containing protein [Devosia sp.]
MHDFIIVGAGSAGCVLANRLTAGGADVLLLEAGGSDDHSLIRTPGTIGALEGTHFDWGYRSVPQKHLYGRRIACPRGRVLGGTSSLNYMVYVRGNRGDYDTWAALGNEGWSYNDVLPYFVKAESNANFQDEYHGSTGPLQVKLVEHEHTLTGLFLEAAAAAGFPLNDDINGAEQVGFGRYQATIGPRGRSNTAEAYLRPVTDRDNLTVVTHALATRVAFEGTRATGVEYLAADGLHMAVARETILAGGSVNSPQILMLSGIGDAEELRKVGIEVRHHLPGVGKNLQDHFRVALRMEIDRPLTMFGMAPEVAAAAIDEFAASGTGIFATNHIEAGGFFSCDPAETYPDTQLFFGTSFGATSADGGGAPDRHGINFNAYINRPTSMGTIRLTSSHPFDPPAIDPNFLATDRDIWLSVESIRQMRRIASAEPFQTIGAKEIFPGSEAQSEEAILDYVRRTGSTTWHLSGTCKMGRDELAVVDADLRVHGIEGLRVVDASVMPTVPSGNTNAPTIMVAERAADLILGSSVAV